MAKAGMDDAGIGQLKLDFTYVAVPQAIPAGASGWIYAPERSVDALAEIAQQPFVVQLAGRSATVSLGMSAV